MSECRAGQRGHTFAQFCSFILAPPLMQLCVQRVSSSHSQPLGDLPGGHRRFLSCHVIKPRCGWPVAVIPADVPTLPQIQGGEKANFAVLIQTAVHAGKPGFDKIPKKSLLSNETRLKRENDERVSSTGGVPGPATQSWVPRISPAFAH